MRQRWNLLLPLTGFIAAGIVEIGLFATIHRRFPAGLSASDMRAAIPLVVPFWVAVAASGITLAWLIAAIARSLLRPGRGN